MSDFREQVATANFWVSWCMPWREDAAEFNAAYQTRHSKGTVFLGIARNDTEDNSKEFMRQYTVPYESARGTNGNIAVDFGIAGVPETFIVDRVGRLTAKWAGPVTAPRLVALVQSPRR